MSAKQYTINLTGPEPTQPVDAVMCGTHFYQWLCSLPSSRAYSYGQVSLTIDTITHAGCDVCDLSHDIGIHLKPSPFIPSD